MEAEYGGCNGNSTNQTSHTLIYDLAETSKVISGALIFAIVLPFVLFEIPLFPIGTTAAVLTGACLMVVSGVVTQNEAYEVLGHKENLTTIFLLLGMMLIAQYFEREMIIDRILCHLLKSDISFEKYVLWICCMTFPLSALFTNDVACVIITPLILNFWKAQKREPVELETILLAVATSANIGSVTTTFGNPQMALIASRTVPEVFSESRLDLRRCMIFLLLPTIVGLAMNYGFLVIYYRWQRRIYRFKNMKLSGENLDGIKPISTGAQESKELIAKNGAIQEIDIQIPSKTDVEIGEQQFNDSKDKNHSMINKNNNQNNQRRLFFNSHPALRDLKDCDLPDQSAKPLHRSLHSLREKCVIANTTSKMDTVSNSRVPFSQNLAVYRSTSAVSLAEFIPSQSSNKDQEDRDTKGVPSAHWRCDKLIGSKAHSIFGECDVTTAITTQRRREGLAGHNGRDFSMYQVSTFKCSCHH